MSDLFATPWTVDHQAPLSMGFPRQEYWSWWPFPSPGIFSTQGSTQHWQPYSLPLKHHAKPSSLNYSFFSGIVSIPY